MLEIFHLGLDRLGGVDGVGAWQLEDGQRRRWLAVEVTVDVVVLGAQLDAFLHNSPIFVFLIVDYYILEVDDAALRPSADHDVVELVFRGEPLAGVDG